MKRKVGYTDLLQGIFKFDSEASKVDVDVSRFNLYSDLVGYLTQQKIYKYSDIENKGDLIVVNNILGLCDRTVEELDLSLDFVYNKWFNEYDFRRQRISV